MKKLLTILLLSFGLVAASQDILKQYTPMTAAGYQFKYLKADSGFNIAFKDTTLDRGTRRPGAVVMRPQDTLLYVWTGIYWRQLGQGGGTIIINAPGIDSITWYPPRFCSWFQNTPTCFDFDKFIVSSHMNFDTSWILHYNYNGVATDSADLFYMKLRAGVNITFSREGDTVTVNGQAGSVGDTTFRFPVLDSLNTPPVSPSLNDIYLVGDVPTGLWVGLAKQIVTWNGTSWDPTVPNVGDQLYNDANSLVSKWTGTAWIRVGRLVIHHPNDVYGIDLSVGPSTSNSFTIRTNNTSRLSVGGSGTITLPGSAGGGLKILTVNNGGAVGSIPPTTNGFVLTLVTGVATWAASSVPSLQAVSDVGNITTRSLYMDSAVLTSDALIHGLTVGRGRASVASNTVFGASAGSQITTAASNVIIGANTGDSVTTGGFSVYVGHLSGHSMKTGGLNVFMGYMTGNKSTAGSNNFIGYFTGASNTTGINNVFFGTTTGVLNTTGFSNTFIGTLAGRSNTTGWGNSYLGINAGRLGSSGFGNVAVGDSALYQPSTGNLNTMVGYNSGVNAQGSYNIGIGDSALRYVSTQFGNGNYNIGIGHNANVRTILAPPSFNTTTNGIAIGANALADSYQLALSDSTTGMYFKNLDSATGTAPGVVGISGDGKWHKYATPSGGGGSGTVTSVAALTLGTTGTDLSSSVANSTTTPVITLNVPTASASNRGALSAADWSTFNNKQAAGDSATYYTKYRSDTSRTNIYISLAGKQATISGTTNRITVSSNVVDISAAYVGQSSITTLGTIGTGAWQGTKVGLTYGGTNADLSATGGAKQVLQQASSGAAITVGALDSSFISGIHTQPYLDLRYAPISGGAYVSSTGTTGDINSYSGTNTPSRIAAVATGQLFVSNGVATLPGWSNILTLPVTTGTGTTAGLQATANSLTTGNGIDESSSSFTTGNIHKITSTSTVVNGGSLLNINSSGANGTASKTVTGETISVTNTGTTGTNVGLNVTASGGSNNYAALFTGRVGMGGVTDPSQSLDVLGDVQMRSSVTNTLRFVNAANSVAFGNIAVTTNTFTISYNSGLNFSGSGGVGFGVGTSPTAQVHIKAGTATAGTAPYKETAGVLLSAIEALTHESNASGGYRSTVALNRYAEGGVIADFVADVNNSGTSETDLLTYTTKASTLAATGEKLVFNATGTFNDLTATSQLQFYFGGTNIGNSGALTVSATGGWTATITVIRTGSTTARSTVNLSTPGASTAVYTTETDITGLTFTNTNIIKVTGTAAGATGGSSDITAKMGFIMWWGAANN